MHRLPILEIIMFEFFASLFAALFAPVPVTAPKPIARGGYYQGDNSNWIITDNGPMQFSNPTGD